MTTYKVYDGEVELATVETQPFSVMATPALDADSPLREFEKPTEMKMMKGESVGGDLALQEEWVEADNKRLKNRLSLIANLNGWNIVSDSEFNSGA